MKLTGSENYATWVADLDVMLRHHRHWSWIEGANKQPPPKMIQVPTPSSATAATSPDIENPTYTTWEDGASNALYCIMMTCESNVKDQIRQTSVPSKVWKKLKNLYKPSNLSTQFGYLSTIWGISLDDYPSVTVRISSPSHYQGVDKAGGTQVDIQSEEKASSECTTIYKLIQKLPDHVTLLGMWYGP